ncbi:MAG: TetR/AcrR family transcriptional regulator [Bacteroidetes bacterium]|nr:MAG: TetR/AcrR family transcriptional regulator [Bacteroidota bacterium]
MQDIIQKISEIYFRYGIKSITMDDLARDLGVSKKTLYLHFKDKKDVVSKVIHHLINSQKCGISEALNQPNTNAIDKLMMMTHFFAEHLKNSNASLTYDLQKYYPDVWDEVIEFKREEVYKHIIDNIHEGIREGIYRDDMNYEIIARAYVSRMEMYQTDLWQPLNKFPLPEVFRTLFIYHIRGIANDKGLEHLEKNAHQWIFN